MNEKQLKETVSILYDMELNNYLMALGIQHLDYQISLLGHKKNFYHPKREEAAFYKEWTGTLFIIGLFLGAIIGGVSGCTSTSSFTGSIDAGFGGLFGGGIGGGIIGALIGLICDATSQGNRDEKYQSEYDAEMKEYNACVEQDDARVRKELKIKQFLTSERDALANRKEQAEALLSEFYMRSGIDRRYRSLIPIAKMDEIISLNICLRLDGENGLYDRVRRELREDAFYTKIEEISSKLDVLISKSDRIYNELLNIGDQCEQMISAEIKSAQIAAQNNKLLGEAVENTKIAAYNSGRIAVEERYQSMLMTFDNIKNQ
ncbi:MAG: hypothetical protein E7608_02770 [Ruminococcaceae bacterium]|nr:hypothetical protein [Oscillospiraceae bacterium]